MRLLEGYQKDLVHVVKAALDMFLIPYAASTQSTMPEPEEVEELLKTFLPSPVETITVLFFRAPLYAIVTLYNVAQFYGCVCPQEPSYHLLAFSDEDRGNKNVAVHVWFADFIGCDRETVLASVERFKETRNAPDLHRRLNLPLFRRNPPTEQDVPSENTPTDEGRTVARQGFGVGCVHHDGEAVRWPTPRGEVRTSPSRPESDADDSMKATNVFQHFKDSKFTGDLSQSDCIDMTLRDYNVCARQHRLSARQKAEFFINVLSSPARTFFFNNARNDMTFEEMANMMVREYNSDARQLHVQEMLETLRLDKHMSETTYQITQRASLKALIFFRG